MHSFTSALFHCVFSTKERKPLITDALAVRLWPYLGGIARENRIKALEIGGVADHLHLLLALPAALSVAKAMQLLKGNSSRWINETFREHRGFVWQEGYGAFSIGIGDVSRTKNYIRNQPIHHQRRTFTEELKAILNRHGIPYDDRMLA